MAEGPYFTVGLRLIQDDDRRLTAELDTSRQPLYTVGEVSKFFFQRKADWLRWRERKGDLPEGRRADNGTRVYSLSDVEEMVWNLIAKRAIGGEQASAALITVAAQLIVWDYHCPHQNPVHLCEHCRRERVLNGEEV